LSVAAVARAAGVHETSIYRRWVSRDNLVLDALLTTSQEQLPIPDTGDLRADLVAFIREVATFLTSSLGGALVRSMTAAGDTPDVAEGCTDFWRSRRTAAVKMFHRAMERGELAQDVDADLAIELLVAPLHFRAILTRQPLDPVFLDRVVDQVLVGIGATDDTRDPQDRREGMVPGRFER